MLLGSSGMGIATFIVASTPIKELQTETSVRQIPKKEFDTFQSNLRD